MLSLHNIINKIWDACKKYVADYEINHIDPHEVSDFDKFRTELGDVLC